jgi:ketosteroid isomerase-like protein
MPRAAYLLAALLLVASTACLSAQDSAIRPAIEAKEAAVQKAIEAKDLPALEKLWSPDMIVNGPGNRVLTRPQIFHAIQLNLLVENSYKNTIESFTTIDDLAIFMGHEELSLTEGPSKGKLLHRRYTDVWKRTGTGWLQIVRQATYIDATSPVYDTSSH